MKQKKVSRGFVLLLFSFFSGIRPGEEAGEKASRRSGNEGGRTRFYYTHHIQCQTRPGQQIAALKRTIRRSCCWGFELFFPLRTVSCWMAVYLSLAAAVFLLHSFLPHHHRHSIRNYTWLYTLCLCLSADCSYYSHLLGFPALPCLDLPLPPLP